MPHVGTIMPRLRETMRNPELVAKARRAVEEDERVRNMPGWDHWGEAIRGMHPDLVCEMFKACFAEIDSLSEVALQATVGVTRCEEDRLYEIKVCFSDVELRACSPRVLSYSLAMKISNEIEAFLVKRQQ